jgi:hypothetical protein
MPLGSPSDPGRMRPYKIGNPAHVETAQKMYPYITPHPTKGYEVEDDTRFHALLQTLVHH